MDISHDSVNRFLYLEAYSPLDLFEEVRGTLNLKSCTLSVNDTVLDKPYSQYMELELSVQAMQKLSVSIIQANKAVTRVKIS